MLLDAPAAHYDRLLVEDTLNLFFHRVDEEFAPILDLEVADQGADELNVQLLDGRMSRADHALVDHVCVVMGKHLDLLDVAEKLVSKAY